MASSDSLTTAEAAERLGISEREVSRLASSGALEAAKRGSVWWIAADAVARRERERPSTGRPLSPAVAWAILLLASGRSDWRALAGHGHQPRRAQAWLAAYPLADNAFRLQRRARRESFDAHPSEIARLLARADVMPTGLSAAAELGLGLHGGRGEAELYAPAAARERIIAEHGLDPGEGPVVLRWVPDKIWGRVVAETPPRAAILVDLLENDDPRVRREARRALAR